MPVDDLRDAVTGADGPREDDLAELVAFRSVADPKQYPPEECEKAAAVGRRRVRRGGAAGRHDVADPGRQQLPCTAMRPAPTGTPTVLLYCHYDVQPPLGEDAWTVPIWELTERDGRWYGRGSADCKGNIVMHLTALRALERTTAASRAASS